MKRFKAFWIVLIAFGVLNAYDAISRFGWQAVDLPPVQFWAFQVWVTIRNIVGFTLLPCALVYWLGRKSRWILFPGFIVVGLVEFSVVYSSRVFHASLAEEWINLLTNTNVNELSQFLEMIGGVVPILVAIAVILLLAWGWILLAAADYPKAGWRSAIVGAMMVLPFVVFNLLTMNWHFGVGQMRYTDFVISTIHTQCNMRGIKNACNNIAIPETVSTRVPVSQLPDVVLVIGESFTRNNWHLYGYDRDTSPRLDALCAAGSVIAYTDVVGTNPETFGAVSLLMTDADAFDKQKGGWTLAEMYRRAGYRTVLISNQYMGESDNTSLTKVFSGCETKISGYRKLPKDACYDEGLVPIVTSELESSGSRPTAVFLHLKGVHFPMKNVSPASEDFFNNEVQPGVLEGLSDYDKDRRNRYDNGLRYGDKVLGMVIDMLATRSRPTCLFYVSDHGESPRSSSWRIYTDVDVYELPCFFWLSPQYREAFRETSRKIENAKDRPMQPYEMTTGLAELGQIILPKGSAKSFLREDFECRQPRRIDKGRIIYRPKREI